MRPLAIAVLPLLIAVSTSRAHDPGLSAVEIVPAGSSVELHITFAPVDAAAILAGTGRTVSNSADARARALGEVAPQIARLTDAASSEFVPADSNTAWQPDTGAVELVLRYDVPPTASGPLEYHAEALALLPPGHRQLAFLGGDGRSPLGELLLDSQHPVFRFSRPATSSGIAPHASSASAATSRFFPFFLLGTEHILTGYDHLVFLLGLIVVCTRLRHVLVIVSCFTVAHSITLGLAALDVLRLPGAFVELMIAASIVFVGVENLIRRGQTRARPWVTFALGLAHGFGFASVLQETLAGVRGADLLTPLLGFNLGVEAGQIAVAAVALIILAVLRWSGVRERALVPATSAFVVLLGGYWLVFRIAAF